MGLTRADEARRLGSASAPVLIVAAILAAVVVLPSPARTPELLADVEWGLRALPEGFGDLEVELHEEPTEFGLGDTTHPSLSPDLHRLHLYGYRESGDARAMARLGRLSLEERQRLWRRRAVVSALIRRWDARLHWSESPAWRSLAGWDDARPLLVYPGAFSRSAGMDSPADDLATFAEELLVPAESMRTDAVARDDRLRCREPSKARFLDERLAELDGTWKPARDCPRFEAWADLQHLPKFEVLFTAPSSSSSQAMFGHLLLRIVREDDDGPGSMQVMQLAALISPLEPTSSYLLRGVGGGFRGVFSLTTLADVQQEALSLEQRSLRRFALELTPIQRTRLLERVWELERVGYIDYRFFKANCATMLRFLLAPVLEGRGPRPTLTPWEMPTQVLDGLAPLLGELEFDEPSGDSARRARQLVEAAPAALRHALEGPPTARIAAYQSAALDARLLLASLRLERYALDLATTARLRAERATVLPGWTGPTTDELVASRQHRYEHETSQRLRAQAELSELLALDEVLRAAPRRTFNASELALLEEEKRARETFEAVAAAVARLPEEALERAREEERATLKAEQTETLSRSVPEGGHGHGEVGAGLNTAGAALLRLRAAALAEQLGDQRLRGLGARSAWRLLDASVELKANGPPLDRANVTVAKVRSLGESGWGWGAGLDYAYLAPVHEVAVSGEALRVLAADRRLTNFLLAAVGLRGGWQTGNAVAYLNAGLSARAQLPGSFGNALRFEGAYLPRLQGLSFQHGAVGTLQLTLRLGVLRGVAFTARAELRAEWRERSGFNGMAGLGVELD